MTAVCLYRAYMHMRTGRLTGGRDAAAAPEDGAVEEADEQRHEHAGEVVGGAAPVRQPELARQRNQLREPRGRIGARHLELGLLLLPLRYEVLYQLLILQVQLAGLNSKILSSVLMNTISRMCINPCVYMILSVKTAQ